MVVFVGAETLLVTGKGVIVKRDAEFLKRRVKRMTGTNVAQAGWSVRCFWRAFLGACGGASGYGFRDDQQLPFTLRKSRFGKPIRPNRFLNAAKFELNAKTPAKAAEYFSENRAPLVSLSEWAQTAR